MDVRALPADLAARRFERERAEVAKHKPHVLAPEDISADAVSEADGHVDRSKARDPREERKGKPSPARDPGQSTSTAPGLDKASDEPDGDYHLDVRV